MGAVPFPASIFCKFLSSAAASGPLGLTLSDASLAPEVPVAHRREEALARWLSLWPDCHRMPLDSFLVGWGRWQLRKHPLYFDCVKNTGWLKSLCAMRNCIIEFNHPNGGIMVVSRGR